MDFYQKVELSNPSSLMQEQTLLDIMQEFEISLKINEDQNEEDTDNSLKYAYTIEGRQIKSLMDLHQ